MKTLLVMLALAACGTDKVDESQQPNPSSPADVYYKWDGRRVLCSVPIDDLTGVTRNWTAEESRVKEASKQGWVTFAHAHIPGTTVSRDALDQMLTLADQNQLDYIRFSDMDADHPHGGLAFAFDDTSITEWLSIRDLLQAHRAKVTFFISKWQTLTPDDLRGIATLAADGHDIEPHSVNHVHAVDYVSQHGVADYVQQEVVPSIEAVNNAGYHATSYAYPFGEHDDAIDAAVLQVIGRVRTTPGECPP
ncbi:MAG: polysaccharide deacetylase family protein [Deltaproteobacteria bacterium]|nr:polysaccharide deacetylase family protein [Deltaproteobacteria bacterium]